MGSLGGAARVSFPSACHCTSHGPAPPAACGHCGWRILGTWRSTQRELRAEGARCMRPDQPPRREVHANALLKHVTPMPVYPVSKKHASQSGRMTGVCREALFSLCAPWDHQVHPQSCSHSLGREWVPISPGTGENFPLPWPHGGPASSALTLSPILVGTALLIQGGRAFFGAGGGPASLSL